jgi:hypothetical protein
VGLRNCAFENIETVADGGAVYINYPAVTLDKVRISGATSGGAGGGLWLSGMSQGFSVSGRGRNKLTI